MPITPFHFGPGALIHAIAPKHISFLAFCSANVLIDVEPLYYMLTAQPPLHRFFHTYIGATIIALIAACSFLGALRIAPKLRLPDLLGWQSLKTLPIWLGAATGSYSHIVLDSVMHADIVPLAPFSEVNALYRIVTLGELHLFCLVSALAAGILMAIRYLMKEDFSS